MVSLINPHGITPAWAGKRTTRNSGRKSTRDHPRMGGEKRMVEEDKRQGAGSPPRGRGKAVKAHDQMAGARITPAWAGKRLTRPAMTGTPRDHPRVGGEKVQLRSGKQTQKGSPPHGRGKVDTLRESKLRPRITPAWAGKRIQGQNSLCARWDHPRMGGEKSGDCPRNVFSSGSPPRRRGKVYQLFRMGYCVGITPA